MSSLSYKVSHGQGGLTVSYLGTSLSLLENCRYTVLPIQSTRCK